MSEQHEGETRPLAAEGGQPPVAQPHPTGAPAAPPPTSPPPPPPGGGRFRRWSRSAPAQFAAVGLIAGLVGGLVGGGIVAAVGGGHHDQPQLVRIERGMPPGFGPGQFGRAPRGRFFPMRPRQPRPSPTATS